MGAWGPGLYSSDYALDLRSTIRAICRLPFEIDRLIDILIENSDHIASDPRDEEYTTFWLVTADQLRKRGIDSPRVREMALQIIQSGQDLACMEEMGMPSNEVRKRQKKLTALRESLLQPVPQKARDVLTQPQPLLMNQGDVMAYPTSKGEAINPYFRQEDLRDTGWTHDGWGAALVIDCGRAFEYLAWYRLLTIADAMSERPTHDSIQGDHTWTLRLPGTCPKSRYRRIGLEKVATLAIDLERRDQLFPTLVPGNRAAVDDLCISNGLNVGPHTRPTDLFTWKGTRSDLERVPFPSISRLSELLAT